MTSIIVHVTSRLVLESCPKDLRRQLVSDFSHTNPAIAAARRGNRSTWGIPATIQTWREEDGVMSLPRGGTGRLRAACKRLGYRLEWRDERVQLAPVKFPPFRLKLRGYQEEAVAAFLRYEQGICKAPTGCISNDAIIGVNRAGKSFNIRLGDLVMRFHGGAVSGKTWDPNIATTVRVRDDDGYVRLVRLRDAWASGRKVAYRIRTESGHQVEATASHPFLSEYGWRRLDELRLGDRVQVELPTRLAKDRGGRIKRPKPRYKVEQGLRHHPFAGRRSLRRGGGWSVPLHRLVMEAATNNISLAELLRRCRTGDQMGGLFFWNPKVWTVHHVDEDTLNNEATNLAVMLKGEHHKHHGDDGGWKHVTARTELSPVVELTLVGEIETSDLELDAPHNFLANGMVVHNSGKTTTALAFVARAEQPAIVIANDSNLLKQWAERVVSQMGIPKKQMGMLVGSKRQVGGRITLAMQQTLNAKSFPLDDITSLFGVVLIDECMTPESPVLMADGTLRPISSVRVGDEVAAGGRVLRTFRQWYDGPVFQTGRAGMTGEHPVATTGGWVAASNIRNEDVVWYDPHHDARVHHLREDVEIQQPLWVVSAARSGWSRPGYGEMSDLRGVHFPSDGQRHPYADVFGQRHLEQRAFGRDGRAGQGIRAEEPRSYDACSCAGRSDDQPQERGMEARSCEGAATEIRQSTATGGFESQSPCACGCWENHTLRWQEAREWGSSDRVGRDTLSPAPALWVPAGSGGERREGFGCSLVPIGLGTPRHQVGCRDRWPKSHDEEKAGERFQKGLLPEVSRLDCVEIPGLAQEPNRLRRGRSSLRPSRLEHSGLVYNLETETGVYVAGGVLVHNCQGIASKTLQSVVDRFPSRYRIGVSADHTRRDGMEFLTTDVMGAVIHETFRKDLEESGDIVPVHVHMIPTDFVDAAWNAGDREMARIHDLIANDEQRNELVLETIRRLLRLKESPIFVFVHRREHAKFLADTLLYDAGIPCGLLLGGKGDAVRFAEDRARLESGELLVAVGTYKAIGQGTDIPLVRAGVVASPIGDNRQFFGQVRGRICRPSADKGMGHLVYLWDHHLFGRQLGRIHEWSDGRCVETPIGRLLAG